MRNPNSGPLPPGLEIELNLFGHGLTDVMNGKRAVIRFEYAAGKDKYRFVPVEDARFIRRTLTLLHWRKWVDVYYGFMLFLCLALAQTHAHLYSYAGGAFAVSYLLWTRWMRKRAERTVLLIKRWIGPDIPPGYAALFELYHQMEKR